MQFRLQIDEGRRFHVLRYLLYWPHLPLVQFLNPSQQKQLLFRLAHSLLINQRQQLSDRVILSDYLYSELHKASLQYIFDPLFRIDLQDLTQVF